MANLTKHNKEELGLLIAKGHARFGRVAPRKPYQDDDSGTGAAGLTVETHPLLMDLPIGAASDLTAIAAANSEITNAASERLDELTPSLQKQPVLQAQMQQRYSYVPKVTPSPF